MDGTSTTRVTDAAVGAETVRATLGATARAHPGENTTTIAKVRTTRGSAGYNNSRSCFAHMIGLAAPAPVN